MQCRGCSMSAAQVYCRETPAEHTIHLTRHQSSTLRSSNSRTQATLIRISGPGVADHPRLQNCWCYPLLSDVSGRVSHRCQASRCTLDLHALLSSPKVMLRPRLACHALTLSRARTLQSSAQPVFAVSHCRIPSRAVRTRMTAVDLRYVTAQRRREWEDGSCLGGELSVSDVEYILMM